MKLKMKILDLAVQVLISCQMIELELCEEILEFLVPHSWLIESKHRTPRP